MNFKFYQMVVKNTFLHFDIQEEVFVKQPLGFESEEYPNHVYRLESCKQSQTSCEGMVRHVCHLSPGEWIKVRVSDNTLFIKKSWYDIILAQVYVDDIIFGSTDETLSTEFVDVMNKKFKMSMMGEKTFFLGLPVKQLAYGFLFVKLSTSLASWRCFVSSIINERRP